MSVMPTIQSTVSELFISIKEKHEAREMRWFSGLTVLLKLKDGSII